MATFSQASHFSILPHLRENLPCIDSWSSELRVKHCLVIQATDVECHGYYNQFSQAASWTLIINTGIVPRLKLGAIVLPGLRPIFSFWSTPVYEKHAGGRHIRTSGQEIATLFTMDKWLDNYKVMTSMNMAM